MEEVAPSPIHRKLISGKDNEWDSASMPSIFQQLAVIYVTARFDRCLLGTREVVNADKC